MPVNKEIKMEIPLGVGDGGQIECQIDFVARFEDDSEHLVGPINELIRLTPDGIVNCEVGEVTKMPVKLRGGEMYRLTSSDEGVIVSPPLQGNDSIGCSTKIPFQGDVKRGSFGLFVARTTLVKLVFTGTDGNVHLAEHWQAWKWEEADPDNWRSIEVQGSEGGKTVTVADLDDDKDAYIYVCWG